MVSKTKDKFIIEKSEEYKFSNIKCDDNKIVLKKTKYLKSDNYMLNVNVREFNYLFVTSDKYIRDRVYNILNDIVSAIKHDFDIIPVKINDNTMKKPKDL